MKKIFILFIFILLTAHLKADYIYMEPGVSFSSKSSFLALLLLSSGNEWLEGTRGFTDSGKLFNIINDVKPSDCGNIIITPEPSDAGTTIIKDNANIIFRFEGKANENNENDQAQIYMDTIFIKHPIVHGKYFEVAVAEVIYKVVYLTNLKEWHIGILDVNTLGNIDYEGKPEKVTDIYPWIKYEEGGIAFAKLTMKFTSENIVPL